MPAIATNAVLALDLPAQVSAIGVAADKSKKQSLI